MVSTADRVILVIDERSDRAEPLKEMIEFMDAPEVRITVPEEWKQTLGSQRPAAIFLTDLVSPEKVSEILEELGTLDPNIPVVLLSDDEGD